MKLGEFLKPTWKKILITIILSVIIIYFIIFISRFLCPVIGGLCPSITEFGNTTGMGNNLSCHASCNYKDYRLNLIKNIFLKIIIPIIIIYLLSCIIFKRSKNKNEINNRLR